VSNYQSAMLEPPFVHELDDAIGVVPGRVYRVSGADLIRWADETARARAEVAEERLACRRIVEDHLRLMLVERGADPVLLVRGMLARMAARGDVPPRSR
jgi:hypothetical protein